MEKILVAIRKKSLLLCKHMLHKGYIQSPQSP